MTQVDYTEIIIEIYNNTNKSYGNFHFWDVCTFFIFFIYCKVNCCTSFLINIVMRLIDDVI